MKRKILIYLFLILCTGLTGQRITENLIGKVSFISSQNIYVKFKSTSGISVGDTLFIAEGEKLNPALVVNTLSTTSCLCSQIGEKVIPVDHIIIAIILSNKDQEEGKKTGISGVIPPGQEIKGDSVSMQAVSQKSKSLHGTVSAASYSDISNADAGDSQRFRYTLSLNTGNIGGSKLSFDTYISFRHKVGEWQSVSDDIFNALKIYNLSVKYAFNPATSLSAGRRINPRISNIGAMDGIQFEKSFKKFSFGLLAGSRPDYTNYGFDLSLFQYGAYVSLSTKASGKYMENTVAFMEQTNNFITDRRFIYFQHSNTLVKNIRLFSTLELDLYKLENDVPKSTLDLTGLYVSLSYKLSKGLSITGSYDARKNVVYYETYKSYTERIMEDELRQGYRLSGNWRMAPGMVLGIQTGYRFLKSDPHPSANLSGFYTWSRVPGLNLSVTLSGTWLQSNYSDAIIAGMNIRKDMPGGKVQMGAGYHFSDNTLPESNQELIQHIGEVNLYWFFLETMSLSVNYEGVLESGNLFNRIYMQVRKRF